MRIYIHRNDDGVPTKVVVWENEQPVGLTLTKGEIVKQGRESDEVEEPLLSCCFSYNIHNSCNVLTMTKLPKMCLNRLFNTERFEVYLIFPKIKTISCDI